MPGRIQALTSFVVSEIIEADFATYCDRTPQLGMIIYPSDVGSQLGSDTTLRFTRYYLYISVHKLHTTNIQSNNSPVNNL
ncbi:hypothetical protein ACWATR_18375 [Nostoc sp. UIC 10890]